MGNGGSKPKTVETDNQGTPVQVNLGIHAQGCCSNSGTGLFEEAPEIVFKTGLQRHVYEQWIRNLEEIRSMRATGCFDCCCCMTMFTFMWFAPCIVCFMCGKGKVEIEAWDNALRKWQMDFNQQVLNPLGMHIKTRSRAVAYWAGNGEGGVSKHRDISRWLAIALTPQQSAVLQAQPHMEGDIENACCGGPNEWDLCMHP